MFAPVLVPAMPQMSDQFLLVTTVVDVVVDGLRADSYGMVLQQPARYLVRRPLLITKLL